MHTGPRYQKNDNEKKIKINCLKKIILYLTFCILQINLITELQCTL